MSALDAWDATEAAPESAPSTVSKDALSTWDSAAPIPKVVVTAKTLAQNSPIGGDWENAAAGIGKSVVDMGRGAKQLMDVPAQWLEKRFPGLSAWSQEKGLPSAADSAAATNADVAESRVSDAPLMDTKAGMAGNIGGTIASTLLPLGLAAKGGNLINGANAARALMNPASYKAAAASGAISGALVPTIDGESTVHNAGVGAVTGMAGNLAVNTIGRLAQPISNALSSAHEKAVSVLQNAGIPLDAAQQTGSTFLNRVRSSFFDNPITAGTQSALVGQQKAGFNKAVLATVGEDATAATPDVMNQAATRINGVFKDVLNRNNVTISDPVVSKIAAIQQAATEEEKAPVASIANRLMGAVQSDGTVPGQVAYNIKKDLDRLASSPDTTLGYHAKQLRSTLMDTINDSLSPTDQAAFGEARNQFSNMKRIEGVIDKSGSGDISPARLANVMAQKANRGASVYGRGDQQLVDLAHSGNMLLPDKMPNSGTTARIAMQIGAPLIAGGAGGAYSGDWETAGKAALAGAILPKAAQMLINNPASAKYLSQGMQGSMTPLRDLLQLPQTNAIVGGSIRRLPEAYLQRK